MGRLLALSRTPCRDSRIGGVSTHLLRQVAHLAPGETTIERHCECAALSLLARLRRLRPLASQNRLRSEPSNLRGRVLTNLASQCHNEINLGNRERRICHMQAFSITLSLPRGMQKSRLRRVTSPENNEVRKHRAHWSPSLVLEAGAGMEPTGVERHGRSPLG